MIDNVVSIQHARTHHPEQFINRELSFLQFNSRVLAQARDPFLPILERLRFLTISSNNLDEFFEVRVAAVKQQIAYGTPLKTADGSTAKQSLFAISKATRSFVDAQYQTYHQQILPALREQNICILEPDVWDKSVQRWARAFFQREILPLLTPLVLDPTHPFPRIANKRLSFVIALRGTNVFGRRVQMAVVTAPRSLARLIRIPENIARNAHSFVWLSSLLQVSLDTLFPGGQVTGCYPFRVTRNSDLWVDEQEIVDLRVALESELLRRPYAPAVRLEVSQECPEKLRAFLLQRFKLSELDAYPIKGPLNLHRLGAIYAHVDRPDLKYPLRSPRRTLSTAMKEDIFATIRRRDLLMHQPYDSIEPVILLLQQAATDPHVLSIKQTLYRTGADSPIADSLAQAARHGKEVTAVIELRARFDEATNIALASRLQEAGANVVYGVVGLKTHSKMLMVVRREGQRIRRYVHLGTGNYHTGTARLYTDVGLITADAAMGQDVHAMFLQLTGSSQRTHLRKLVQAPFALHRRMLELIQNETDNARQGKKARIIAKMNGLCEPGIVEALYQASQAGVQIDLIVRGICCLRPQMPGISDNIRVRSIVGRFLEHSRVYYFWADGAETMYGSSADWMPRNFFKRVEVAFPIEDASLKKRIYIETLEHYLQDNGQAWELMPNGEYQRMAPSETHAMFIAQERLVG